MVREEYCSCALYQAYCPDSCCFERVWFVELKDSKLIYCFYCGRTFPATLFIDPEILTDKNEIDFLMDRVKSVRRREGTEWTRIDGMSPFFCKIISPMFTWYAIDEKGSIDKITDDERNEQRTFDCSPLFNCTFTIDEMSLASEGYGIDRDAREYLYDMLSVIAISNEGIEVLVPLHVGGDGNCLVHAISRCLVGREIYWHALRENLREHLTENEEWYKKTLGDFIADDDFPKIVNECDPSFVLNDERRGASGLRTVHIFALANFLHRPIVLLDSCENMAKGADYSAIFLPVLFPAEKCKTKGGDLHHPLFIAWAHESHSHFVPLVCIAERNPPVVTRQFFPKAWCVDDKLVEKYITFEDDKFQFNYSEAISSEVLYSEIHSMSQKFTEEFGVNPQVVSDYCEDILTMYKIVPYALTSYIAECRQIALENRLWLCLNCWRLLCVRTSEDLEKIMKLQPSESKAYNENDSLQTASCIYCWKKKNQLRRLLPSGKVDFINKDHTRVPSQNALCRRKMKHFWNGTEYDNLPLHVPIVLEYNSKTVNDQVEWICFEREASRNSNMKKVVCQLTEKHFDNDDKAVAVVEEQFTKQLDVYVQKISGDLKELCKDPLWTVETTVEVQHEPTRLIPKKDYIEDAPCEFYILDDENVSKKVAADPQSNVKLVVTLSLPDGAKHKIPWSADLTRDDIVKQICQLFDVESSEILQMDSVEPHSRKSMSVEFPLEPNSEIIIHLSDYYV